jgi:hypothetical protein
MMCQRCGKVCANRTEGRRVRLAGQDLFVCNVCSLHAMADSGGGDQESVPGIARAAPADGATGCSPQVG